MINSLKKKKHKNVLWQKLLAAGHVPPISSAKNIIIDTVVQSTSAQSLSVCNKTLTISFIDRSKSILETFANVVFMDSVTTFTDGTWSFTPSVFLTDGTYAFTAISVDTAGNMSRSSTSLNATVEIVASTTSTASPAYRNSAGTQSIALTVPEPIAVINRQTDGSAPADTASIVGYLSEISNSSLTILKFHAIDAAGNHALVITEEE
jgi:hypothetical protein